MPTDASIACKPEPVRDAVRVRDAVARASGVAIATCTSPTLPGQSGKIVATFISSSTTAGGRQRRVDVERAHRRPDREELADPAEDLEEDRERRRRPASASRRAPAAPSTTMRRAAPRPSSDVRVRASRADESEGEERDADADEQRAGS